MGLEPISFTQASKDTNWIDAITVEFNVLLTNETWDLVPPQPR